MTNDKTLKNQSEAYQIYIDKHYRTNVSVLIASNPEVTSRIEKKIFPPNNGFITANIDVVYDLKGIPVLTKRCQIMMYPDKSQLTIRTSEDYFAASDLGRYKFESSTITREQFNLMKELFESK